MRPNGWRPKRANRESGREAGLVKSLQKRIATRRNARRSRPGRRKKGQSRKSARFARVSDARDWSWLWRNPLFPAALDSVSAMSPIEGSGQAIQLSQQKRNIAVQPVENARNSGVRVE
jgi:hypothetical protein